MTGIFAGKNLIFITAEAFTAEVIDEDLTPTLYRLATKGIQFTDYYQPAGAGTTGGECVSAGSQPSAALTFFQRCPIFLEQSGIRGFCRAGTCFPMPCRLPF